MNIIKALKDKIGKTSEDGIFLDTITRNNAIREPKNFKTNDVKLLKYLLDVSKVTMWMKSSKEQSELQNTYKKFYKNVSKYLDSLYKHCVIIKKYNTKDFCDNISTCNFQKDVLLQHQSFSNFESNTTPANVVVIGEINRLTNKFNEYRNDKYRSLIVDAGFSIYVSNYTEYERAFRIGAGTTSPIIRIKQFIEDKKKFKDKETFGILVYLTKEDRGDIVSARASVINKLNDLANAVGLQGSSLNKYLSKREDYLTINKGIYCELVNALTKKLKAECEAISKTRDEVTGMKEYQFKQKVKDSIDYHLKKITAENKEKEYKDERSYFESIYMKPVEMCKSLVENITDLFSEWWYSGNNKKKGTGSSKLDKAIENSIVEFSENWISFEMAYMAMANLIAYRDQKKHNLESFITDYEKYIADITKASQKLSLNNEKTTKNINTKELDTPDIKDKIARFNQLCDKINKTVFKLKIEYNSAVDDVDSIKIIIKNFVNSYKEQFVNALRGLDISDWTPPNPCSKLTLGEAVLFVYYSVDRYEKDWHFGLFDYVLTYFDNSNKVKLGLSTDEIRNIINSVNKETN